MPGKLPLRFYRRSTKTVARELLGKILVHQISPGVRLAGKIVETEAYLGLTDPACHSYGPRRTPRTEVMFKKGGYAYVYFIYGMYFCFNVVTESENHPEAVLIRALEPVHGLELMRTLRTIKKTDSSLASTPGIERLCNGPGKLCAAMAITKKHSGLLLTGNTLWIEDSIPVQKSNVVTCKRIGITQASALHWPLRFYIRDSKHVSKYDHTPRIK